jgi:hypothetical protein
VARRFAFPADTWAEIEALPAPASQAIRRVLAYHLQDPVPSLAKPFPDDGDPVPGAYELHLPSDGVTLWYVIAQASDGAEVISVMRVRLG